MNKKGPIVIIDDDVDDQFLFKNAYDRLGFTNELLFFQDGNTVLPFLSSDSAVPFMIISDINMPGMNGFELRRAISLDENMRLKCIPFLFFSTASSKKSLLDAYSLSVQGFFVKPSSIDELTKTIKVVVEYWKVCSTPLSLM